MHLSWRKKLQASLSQFRGHLLQIPDDRRPAFFPKDGNCFVLRGAPGRLQLGQSCPPLLRDFELYVSAPSSPFDLHQTIPLQRSQVAQQCRSLHPEPSAQFGHGPTVPGLQCPQDGRLRWAQAAPPRLRIKKLRNRPRSPPHIETSAVLHRRHIQRLLHFKCIYTLVTVLSIPILSI